MAEEKILITPRSLTAGGHPALARFEEAGYELVRCTPGQQPGEEELLQLLPGCVGYLAGVERVSRRVLEHAHELRAISRNGVGVNNIDLEAARQRQIAVLRVEGANARGVAELTIALTLSLVRHIAVSDHRLKQGIWERRKGVELVDRTLGLVGCGHIGRLVAQLATALGMQVLGFDPVPHESLAAMPGFRYADLERVLGEADVVSLHAPAPPDGQPLLTRERIARMKEGAYVINTARGELWDDSAVIAALDSGKLAGVAIDAFRHEPPGSDPLVLHEKTIAVPHIGAFTEESVSRAVAGAVDNLIQALEK